MKATTTTMNEKKRNGNVFMQQHAYRIHFKDTRSNFITFSCAIVSICKLVHDIFLVKIIQLEFADC